MSEKGVLVRLLLGFRAAPPGRVPPRGPSCLCGCRVTLPIAPPNFQCLQTRKLVPQSYQDNSDSRPLEPRESCSLSEMEQGSSWCKSLAFRLCPAVQQNPPTDGSRVVGQSVYPHRFQKRYRDTSQDYSQECSPRKRIERPRCRSGMHYPMLGFVELNAVTRRVRV